MLKFDRCLKMVQDLGLGNNLGEVDPEILRSFENSSLIQSIDPKILIEIESSPSWSEALSALQGRDLEASKKVDFDESRLAWYRSFHFEAEDCGMYLSVEGIGLIAEWILRDNFPTLSAVTSEDYRDAIIEATWVLLDHEFFHHQVEVAVTNLEFLTKEKIYVPSRLKLNEERKYLEEALATSEMASRRHGRRSVSRFRGDESLLDRLSSLPLGYRDANKYLLMKRFNEGKASLSELYFQTQLSSAPISRRVVLASYDSLFSPTSRLFVVGDKSPLSRAITELMDCFYLTLSPAELTAALEKHFQYQVDYQFGKGSHAKLTGTQLPMLIIPRRDPVSREVFTSIVADLGYRGRRRELFKKLHII